MNNIKNFAEQYISDENNREDLRFFQHDKDENLFKKIVYSWGQAQGLDKSNANLLSTYVIDLFNCKYNY